jgi:hypothetical protein
MEEIVLSLIPLFSSLIYMEKENTLPKRGKLPIQVKGQQALQLLKTLNKLTFLNLHLILQ